MNSKNSADFLIVGAGISGLALAHFLKVQGASVLILEKSSSSGGVIRSISDGGYLFEAGPSTVQARSQELIQLAEELGLQVQFSNPQAEDRFIFTPSGLKKIPLSPWSLITTPLIPWSERVRFALKEFFPSKIRRSQEEEESVKEFTCRIFGERTYENLVQPFLNGVLAQDGNTTSARALFKELVEKEQASGSLLRNLKRNSSRGENSRGLLSFPGGLEDLPKKLSEKLGSSLKTQCAVDLIFHREGLWHGGGPDGEVYASARNVILTTPLPLSANLLRAPQVDCFHYMPLVVLGLGAHCREIHHSLEGFGFLSRRDVQTNVLGCIWSSSLFPRRAPADHVFLNFYLGGEGRSSILDRPTETLVEDCSQCLKEALGLPRPPQFSTVFEKRLPQALPKFSKEFSDHLEILAKFESENQGLRFFGNHSGGVSLNDRVVRAKELSQILLSR